MMPNLSSSNKKNYKHDISNKSNNNKTQRHGPPQQPTPISLGHYTTAEIL